MQEVKYEAGNSVAANVLLDLARLAGRPDLKERSDAIVKAFAGDINANPMAHAHMLQQLMDARDPMPATKEEKEGAA